MDGLAAVSERVAELQARLGSLAPPVPARTSTSASTGTSTSTSTGTAATSFSEALDTAVAGTTATASSGTTSTAAAAAPSAAWARYASTAAPTRAATTPAAATPATTASPATPTSPATAATPVSTATPVSKASPGTPRTPATTGRLNTHGIPADLAAYGNGKVPASALSGIGHGSHRLWAPAAQAFRRLEAAAEKAGVELGVTDSYRSYAEQVDLARRKGLYSQGGLAATPGTSDHGWGRSLDLHLDSKALAWMRAHADEYGFDENVPRESWHWTYTPPS